MVEVVVGDLFQSNVQTLVNTVNCVGVMGKGVAKEFKERFPEMYRDYVARCERHEVRLGEPYLFRDMIAQWVLNFPTKDHWRSLSKLSDIIIGLEYLEQHHKEWGIISLAVPPLGCGNGGLSWELVGPTLHRYLNRFDIPIELYAPLGTPSEQLDVRFLERNTRSYSTGSVLVPDRLNPAWFCLAETVKRINLEPYHHTTGRIIYQKLAYFATREGLPTGLHFERDSYGPFAAELSKVTSRLINNGILCERKIEHGFEIAPGPAFNDTSSYFAGSIERWGAIIDRVTDLFLRMDARQAEIAGTVAFVTDELRQSLGEKPTEKEVLAEVKQWKLRRKPPLDDKDIASSIRNLALLRWLDVVPSPDMPLPAADLLAD